MGEERELTLIRIGSVAQAVELIAQNTVLDGKLSYRIGLLGDYCVMPLKRLEKESNKLISADNSQRTSLIESKSGDSIADAKIESKLTIMNNDLSVKLAELRENTEKIKVPELKLDNFIAKKEVKYPVKHVDKDGVEKTTIITIEAGQALVPVKFFTLMGDLITD